MVIKFYGTRGLVPVSNREFMEFRGNTTCVFFSAVDEGAGSIIMDARTGIRKLGKEIAAGIVKIMSYKIKVFILSL